LGRHAIVLEAIGTRMRTEALRALPAPLAVHPRPRRRERPAVVVPIAIKPRSRRHRHRRAKRASAIPTPATTHRRRRRLIAAVSAFAFPTRRRRGAEGARPSARIPPRPWRTVGPAGVAAAATATAIPRTTLLCARTIAVVIVVVASTSATVSARALTMCPFRAARRRGRRATAVTLGDGHPRHAQRHPCGNQNYFPAAHRNHLAPGASPAIAKTRSPRLKSS
jgi:hypothetical protein